MANAKKLVLGAALLGAFVAAGFAGWIYFGPNFSRGDPLCNMVDAKLKMQCAVLASPSLYENGAIIKSPANERNLPSQILPDDHTLSKSCVFSNENINIAKFEPDPNAYLDFGTHRYEVDRNANIGAKLELPKVAGLTLKAGPHVSDVSSVIIEADSAQYFNIDTSAFMSVLGSCKVRTSCIARAGAENSHVVKRFLVAKNLRYRIENKNGASETLSAALKSGKIVADIDASKKDSSSDDLSSGHDMVFAVAYFDQSEIQSIQTCTDPLLILTVTGQTKLKVDAGTVGENPLEKEVAGDQDITVTQRGKDAPERKMNEAMEPSEATAFGGWSFDAASGTLSFHLRNFVSPGLRYSNENHNIAEARKLATVYAVPSSLIRVDTETAIANRLEQRRNLVATLAFNVQSTRDVKQETWFSPLTVITSDGAAHEVPAVWSMAADHRDFVLGPVGPGEVLKVRMGHELQTDAKFPSDGGLIKEDLAIKFSLQ